MSRPSRHSPEPDLISASDASRTAEGFAALVDWVAALHGSGSLEQSLGRLSRLAGAEAALVLRQSPTRERHRCVTRWDKRPDAASRVSGLAQDILAELPLLRMATVVFLSDLREDLGGIGERGLTSVLPASGVLDLAVLVLERGQARTDYIELQFRSNVRRSAADQMHAMAAALTTAWLGRTPGTAERLIKRSSTRNGTLIERGGHILDAGNPAGLSRSEFRICALMREGLQTRAIAEQLMICESTVRSHLGSIYSKTQTTGQVQLTHRLVAERPLTAGVEVMSA